jgi:hypothetical protein
MNLFSRNNMQQRSFLLIIAIYLLSCAEPDDLPNAKGDVVGYVHLTDASGEARFNHSGVTVQLIGRINRTVLTNENGKFEFKSVPAGSYSIRASKNEYDAYQLDAVSHLGGSVNLVNFPTNSIMLAQKSPNKIIEWQAELLTSGDNTFLDHYLNVMVEFDEASFNSNSSVIVFINDQPGVSPENYTGILYAEELTYIGGGAYENAFFLFGNRPLKGAPQYIKAYAYNGGTPYRNIEKGLDVYPSLGEGSTELSFIYQ